MKFDKGNKVRVVGAEAGDLYQNGVICTVLESSEGVTIVYGSTLSSIWCYVTDELELVDES